MKRALPLLLFPILASAAFFLKRPSHPADWVEKQGGERIQDSPITLNGAPGSLSLYSLHHSALDLEERLRSLDPALAAHIFLLPCGAPAAPQTLAFVLQTDTPPSVPPVWPWSDLPPAVGFAPTFSATLNQERTSFIAGATGHSVPSTRATWSTHLTTLGWTPVSPAPSSTSLILFAKGRETLALTLLPSAEGGTRLSLLRRSTQK